jgi:hypothetical protein
MLVLEQRLDVEEMALKSLGPTKGSRERLKFNLTRAIKTT